MNLLGRKDGRFIEAICYDSDSSMGSLNSLYDSSAIECLFVVRTGRF